MLFTKIADLVRKDVKLHIVITAVADQKLEVSVLPSTEESTSGMNLVAKSFVGTPDELDAEFPSILEAYAAINVSLKDQLDAVDSMAKEIAQAASAKVVADRSAAASKKPTSVKSGSAAVAPKSARDPSLLDDDDLNDEIEIANALPAPGDSPVGAMPFEINL